MNILKKSKKMLMLPLISIGISFFPNFNCFGMENAIANVFKTKDLICLIFDKVLWTANNPGEEVCKFYAFAFTNRFIHSKFKEMYGNKLEGLNEIVRRARLAPLLKKTLVWAPNGMDNLNGQVRLPFLSAYESRFPGACFDISGWGMFFGFMTRDFHEITLDPKHFFTRYFIENIWLITTRDELTRFYKKEKRISSNTIDPYGLAKVLSGVANQAGSSMFILYRNNSYNIDNYEYNYGEFGPIHIQLGKSLYDYICQCPMRSNGLLGESGGYCGRKDTNIYIF